MREKERVDTPAIKAKRQLGTTTRNKALKSTQPAGVVRRWEHYEIINCRASTGSGRKRNPRPVCILADEMGLGKTIQSAGLLASLIYERAERRTGGPRSSWRLCRRYRTGNAN